MTALTKEVLLMLDSKIKRRGASIKMTKLPEFPVYPLKMKQILYHLINNALQYNEGKPIIKISGGIEDKNFILSIQDNGTGIDASQSGNIFKPFFRLNPDDKIQGSGLGLSICQKAAEKHGGTILVNSVKGQGATFQVCLPAETL